MLPLYKPAGLTPLQTLDALRQLKPEYRPAVLSYAGRLDPLAEGVMLVLVGEENKEREQYLNLDKGYELAVLFGASTDTHDLLGRVLEYELPPGISSESLQEALAKFIGSRMQTSPKFSSPGIDGKEFTKEVEIKALELISRGQITTTELKDYVLNQITPIQGDFRQREILDRWSEVLADRDDRLQFATIKVLCTSGTYMRLLAYELGRQFGAPALALKIVRTSVGDYNIDDCLRLQESRDLV